MGEFLLCLFEVHLLKVDVPLTLSHLRMFPVFPAALGMSLKYDGGGKKKNNNFQLLREEPDSSGPWLQTQTDSIMKRSVAFIWEHGWSRRSPLSCTKGESASQVGLPRYRL